MAKQQKKPPEEEVQALPETSWDRIIDDWRRHPRKWLTVLGATGLILVVALVVSRQISGARESGLIAFNDKLEEALKEEEPGVRVQRVEALRSDAEEEDWHPVFLLRLARECRSAADAERDPDERVRLYDKAVAAAEELTSKYPNSPQVLLPWSIGSVGDTKKPPAARGLLEYCRQQREFLKQQPMPENLLEPDSGLECALQVEDPEGKAHTLKLRFFSRQAPLSVDTFLRLAREGWFDGTLVYAIEHIQIGGEDDIEGIHLGSAMTKVSPQDDSLWGDTRKDRVGFTVPGERNALQMQRGRVALEWYQDALGSSPVRLVIATKEPRFASFSRRTVFAEVFEGLDVLDSIAAAETDTEKTVNVSFAQLQRLKKPWKVKGLTVTGEAARKPEVPIKDAPKLPEPPEKKTDPSGDQGEAPGNSGKPPADDSGKPGTAPASKSAAPASKPSGGR